jgi:hypothetical protein
MFVRRHIGSCLRCVDLGNAFSHLHAAAVQFVCEFRFATFISWTATEPRPDPRVDRLCDSSIAQVKIADFVRDALDGAGPAPNSTTILRMITSCGGQFF